MNAFEASIMARLMMFQDENRPPVTKKKIIKKEKPFKIDDDKLRILKSMR